MEAAGVGNGGLVGNESRPRSQICVLQPLASIFQLPDLSLFFFFFFPHPWLGKKRPTGGWWLVGGGGLAPWILSCFCKKNIFFPYTPPLLSSFGPRAVNNTLWFSGPHTVHCAKSLFFLPLCRWSEPSWTYYERMGVGVGGGAGATKLCTTPEHIMFSPLFTGSFATEFCKGTITALCYSLWQGVSYLRRRV